MLSLKALGNVFFISSALLFIDKVYAQTASDDSRPPPRFRSCEASSSCIPIRRCSPLRDGWKRRGVGITCGYGMGLYRLVCCPRGSRGEDPVRQERRPTTTTPLPPPNKEEDCGLSQGMDWFRDQDDADTMEATWPWMVAFKILLDPSGSSAQGCSGFLIDKTHVLSAAHCFLRKEHRFVARIGSDDQNLAEEYPVIHIEIHPDYIPDFSYNDIAIATLAREVNTSNFVPLCLPDDRVAAMDLTGWGATFLGWGLERFDGVAAPELKQLDSIPIVTNKECFQILNDTFPDFRRGFPRGITEELMCAGKTAGSRDSCLGDSGGPLMILYRKRWYAVGLASSGFNRSAPFIPSWYTKISSYVDWIKQNTQNTSSYQDTEDSETQYAGIQPR